MDRKPKPRTKRAKRGDFVRIPIDETQWGYGRVTEDETVAVYDIVATQELPVEDIQNLPILFRVPVMTYALNGKEWPVVGNLPLKQELQKPAEFLSARTWQNTKGLYYGTPDETNYYLISYEHAKTLELMMIYDASHVVDRIVLHMKGQPYLFVERTRVT